MKGLYWDWDPVGPVKKVTEVGSLYYFACGSGQSDMKLVGVGKTTLRVYRMLAQCSMPHLLLSFIHLY